MEKGEKILRLEEAVSYLVSLNLVDGKATIKDIANKMNRHKNNVSSALSGDERYLTWKFVKDFCATFDNTISPYWIWDGKGEMLITKTDNIAEHIAVPDNINKMEKSQLVSLLTSMIDTYNKILDNNRNLQEHIRLCEEIARRDQENFKHLMSQIEKMCLDRDI